MPFISDKVPVDTNTILGYMGNTGYSFGVHLHLEVYPCRIYVDNDFYNQSTTATNSKQIIIVYCQEVINDGHYGGEH